MRKVLPNYDAKFLTLGDVLVPTTRCRMLFIPDEQLPRWEYLRGSKSEERVASNGFSYRYQEGGIAYPDPTDRPSRTILTGEGGSSPSRFKHVVEMADGRLRRLTPRARTPQRLPRRLDQHRDARRRRAFMMGNALVVGLIQRVGAKLEAEWAMRSAKSD